MNHSGGENKAFAPEAATALIVRDAPEYQVLMVTRHKAMNFGASAMVFPGGKVALADHDPAWSDYVAGAFSPDERARRIAAVREVFEETGLLLARCVRGTELVGKGRAEKLGALRLNVEADPALFLQMISEQELVLALDLLVGFAHWVTPDIEPRRFDTHFYLVQAPSLQEASHDGHEAVAHEWVAPELLLRRYEQNEAALMFPTRLNIQRLAESANLSAAIQAAKSRTPMTVQPTVIKGATRTRLRIPAEAGYLVTEEWLDVAKSGRRNPEMD